MRFALDSEQVIVNLGDAQSQRSQNRSRNPGECAGGEIMFHSVVSDEWTGGPVHQNDFRKGCIETPDFRIKKIAGHLWEIMALSQSAASWLRSNFDGPAGSGNDNIRTDLAGANRFMREARGQYYRIEYIGPHSTNVF
jgi:hypothetical protein